MNRTAPSALLRAIRHWSFNLLVIASLLLCTATISLWADSYRAQRMDQFVRGQRVITGIPLRLQPTPAIPLPPLPL